MTDPTPSDTKDAPLLEQVERPGSIGRREPTLLRFAPWLVLAVGFLGEAAVLLIQDHRLWFFRDDFAFMFSNRLSHQPIKTLLTPHNEHWSTLPIIVFRVMWHVFGLRHYLPYALMPLLLHLGVAGCLVVLVRRAGVSTWPAVLAGLSFAYLGGGAGAENTLWAFQIGFIGSCLGGVAALICFDRSRARDERPRGGRWFWSGQVLLVGALLCSGMGVPMVVTAGAWALLRSGWLPAVRVVALPFVVYVTWYVTWGHTGFASAPPLTDGLERAPAAAANGMANIWSAATLIPGAGPVVLLLLVVAVVLIRHRRPMAALGAAGLVGVVAEYLIVGFGRSRDGVAYAEHSRYLYIGMVLCAPAVACALELVARRLRPVPRVTAVAWMVVAVLLVVAGSIGAADFATSRRAEDPDRRQELLAAAVLIRRGASILSDRIDRTDIYRHPAMSVTGLKGAGVLSKLPAGRPGARAIFDERSVLQVGLRESAMQVPRSATYHWADRWTNATAPRPSGRPVGELSGCTTRVTTGPQRLDVPLGTHGGQVQINLRPRTPTGQSVQTRIFQRGHASVRLFWPLTASWELDGPRLFAASTMHRATLNVTLPAGRIRVCGARSGRHRHAPG